MIGIKMFAISSFGVKATSRRQSPSQRVQRELTTIFSYEPGDVAVIHPEASSVDVSDFLTTMGWSNAADRPIWIQHIFEGVYKFRPLVRYPPFINHHRSKSPRSSSSRLDSPCHFHALPRYQCGPQTVLLPSSQTFRHRRAGAREARRV